MMRVNLVTPNLPSFVVNVFDYIFHSALEKFAKLCYRIGGDTVSIFDGIIGGAIETHLLKAIT